MAITIRMTDEQECNLERFMKSEGHITKSKAIIWLIENGEKLTSSKNKLDLINDEYRKLKDAKSSIDMILGN